MIKQSQVRVPAGADGKFSSSPGSTFCANLFQYPFCTCVTTVACKRSQSFCQKCRQQVTAKTYAPYICRCAWNDMTMVHGVHRMCRDDTMCSGMIACACGMSEWSVECECVCRRMDEWMVSGWNECDCVARAPAPCNTGWKLNCSQLLWSIHIYTTIGVCVRDQRDRDKREKTGINSVCLEDCFWLHWNQQHYTYKNQTTL